MRTTLTAAGGLALLAALALPSPASAGNGNDCPRAGRTIVANDHARVWRVPVRDGADRHYGCVFRSGRVTRLDPRGGQLVDGSATTRLAGTTVAYETADFDLRPYRIVVRSLRTGRTIHSATSNAHRSAEGHTGPAVRVVLRSNGSVAWAASVECVCEEVDPSVNGWEIHALVRGERRRVLDSGPGVDANSLRLANRGRELRWRHGAETRSAPFG